MGEGDAMEYEIPDCERLVVMARQEVRAVLKSLPAPLRERAEALPVTCEHWPSEELEAEGITPDTLGLFVGPAYADEEATTMPLPPQIILYLDNLWDLAEGDEEVFRSETRTTYLHELGHYLGLTEDDLMDRGLE